MNKNFRYKSEVNILVLMLFLFLFVSCSSNPLVILNYEKANQTSTWNSDSVEGFLAGAAEVDITPPPGLPMFGYSRGGVKKAIGYILRLKVRTIVLRDAQKKKIALIQLDLGATSELLCMKIVNQAAKLNFQPGELLISASHTHAGPGGIFGESFYNAFGSGRSGFYPELIEWISARVMESMQKAEARMVPALIAAYKITIQGLTKNRSIAAWINNYETKLTELPYRGTIPEITFLKIIRKNAFDQTKLSPIAVYAIVPTHATVIGQKNKYYHGDVIGVAARIMQNKITAHYNPENSFVAALAIGPQGDVSPNCKAQTWEEALRLGNSIAEELYKKYIDADNLLSEPLIRTTFQEISLPSAAIDSENKLCADPMVGVAVLGGAEDGRSSFYGKLNVFEGNRKVIHLNSYCQGAKKAAGGILGKCVLKLFSFPEIAPLQIIELKDVMVIATIPGEPTTDMGYRIKEAIDKIMKTNRCNPALVSIVALANGYFSYISTFEEYQAQHFEGAFTLYGPHEGIFFQSNIERMSGELITGESKTDSFEAHKFRPGDRTKSIKLVPDSQIENEKWQLLDTCVSKDEDGKIFAKVLWRGLAKGELPTELPSICIFSEGTPLRNLDGSLETDSGLNFVVSQISKRIWEAKWYPSSNHLDKKRCQFKIVFNAQTKVESTEFDFSTNLSLTASHSSSDLYKFQAFNSNLRCCSDED